MACWACRGHLRGFEPQTFPCSIVEFAFDVSKGCVGNGGDIGPFGEVLTNQSVPIFV